MMPVRNFFIAPSSSIWVELYINLEPQRSSTTKVACLVLPYTKDGEEISWEFSPSRGEDFIFERVVPHGPRAERKTAQPSLRGRNGEPPEHVRVMRRQDP